MATGFFYFTKEEVESPVIRFVDVRYYATLGNVEWVIKLRIWVVLQKKKQTKPKEEFTH